MIQCPHCLADNSEESQVCCRCGSSLEDSFDTFTSPVLKRTTPEGFIYFAPGEVFADRYQIIEEIGRGGMGIVYKAEDQQLGIKVALKLIDPFYSSSSSMVQRFKKETLLTRSITHENVIRIHDIGQYEDVVFISMDYIAGQNLRQLIRSIGTLGTDSATNIAQQICTALAAAHKKGIIHRDLKSQNIMVDKNGHVYAMDFGLAKSMEGRLRGLKPHGRVMGTPAYMSPEQAKGEEVDHRSDIYSLGVIMFELYTGARPFAADSKTEYIEKHINEFPEMPSKLNPNIPDHIEKIILKCLEKDQGKRFQSAEEILKAIGSPLEKLKPEKKRDFGRILRYWYVLPLILVGVIGAYFIFRNKGVDEKPVYPLFEELGRKPVAIMEFENNTGDESLNHWARLLQNWLMYDLSQSKHFRILADDTLLQIIEEQQQQDSTTYSASMLDEIAVKTNVRFILLGSYAKAGENFWITVKIKEVGKEEYLGTVRADGTLEGNHSQLVDDLTKKIKAQFNLTHDQLVADIDQDVEVITTGSHDAWRFYNYGDRLTHERKYEEAITYFEKAIELDSDFALAYKRVAESYRRLRDLDKHRENLLKAVELQDRVSERDRLLIKASVSFYLKDSIPDAIEIYKELLNIYPDDADGNLYLGGTFRYIEEWDQALPYYETVFKNSSTLDRAVALDNVAIIYLAKGWYDQALEILKVNEEYFSNPAFYHRYLTLIYLIQNKRDHALAELKKAEKIEPDNLLNSRYEGNIHLIHGDTEAAGEVYETLKKSEDERARSEGIYHGMFVDFTLGKYQDCLRQIEEGLEISQKPTMMLRRANYYLMQGHINLRLNRLDEAWEASHQFYEVALESQYDAAQIMALLMRGFTQVELDKLEDARSSAGQLREIVAKSAIMKHLRYYHLLQGRILKREGKPKQALMEFEKALSLLHHQQYLSDNHALFMEDLALVHYEMRNYDEAIEIFTQISRLTTGRATWGDTYALSFYWLGKSYQANNQANRAKDSYRRFLELWREADPNLHWIQDARKQLNSL